MRRRRGRAGSRGGVLWLPLLAIGAVLVVAGGANRVYHLHPEGVTDYGVVVIGLALIALYTLNRIRRWWR